MTVPVPPPPATEELPRRRSVAGRALGGVIGLVALLVLVALVVNALVTSRAEEEAAARIAEEVGAEAQVTISRWPTGLRLLAGEPVDATVAARDVPLEGSPAVIDRLDLDATGVVLSLAGDGGLTAEDVTFTADIDEEGVRQLAGVLGQIPLTDIQLRNGVARLTVALFPVVDATAEVDDGQIVLRPTAPIGSFVSVGLPIGELPLGFTFTDVEIRDGLLRLTGGATDFVLED